MTELLAVIAFYVGLGGLLTMEEAGVFLLPGDISMVGAGVYGAQGGPFILLSWVASTIGMVAGSLLLFHGVRKSGSSSRVLPDRARNLILRHGALGVFAARLLPGLRNATVFAAAASGMPLRTFLEGLIPAAALWSGVLILLGWFGGQAILDALGNLEQIPLLRIIPLLLLIAGVSFIILRLRMNRQENLLDS